MRKPIKWLLGAAIAALIVACVSPRASEADWRQRWGVGYSPYAASPYPRAYRVGRGLYVTPGPVMAFPQSTVGAYSIFYSPRPYVRAYTVP